MFHEEVNETAKILEQVALQDLGIEDVPWDVVTERTDQTFDKNIMQGYVDADETAAVVNMTHDYQAFYNNVIFGIAAIFKKRKIAFVRDPQDFIGGQKRAVSFGKAARGKIISDLRTGPRTSFNREVIEKHGFTHDGSHSTKESDIFVNYLAGELEKAKVSVTPVKGRTGGGWKFVMSPTFDASAAKVAEQVRAKMERDKKRAAEMSARVAKEQERNLQRAKEQEVERKAAEKRVKDQEKVAAAAEKHLLSKRAPESPTDAQNVLRTFMRKEGLKRFSLEPLPDSKKNGYGFTIIVQEMSRKEGQVFRNKLRRQLGYATNKGKHNYRYYGQSSLPTGEYFTLIVRPVAKLEDVEEMPTHKNLVEEAQWTMAGLADIQADELEEAGWVHVGKADKSIPFYSTAVTDNLGPMEKRVVKSIMDKVKGVKDFHRAKDAVMRLAKKGELPSMVYAAVTKGMTGPTLMGNPATKEDPFKGPDVKAYSLAKDISTAIKKTEKPAWVDHDPYAAFREETDVALAQSLREAVLERLKPKTEEASNSSQPLIEMTSIGTRVKPKSMSIEKALETVGDDEVVMLSGDLFVIGGQIGVWDFQEWVGKNLDINADLYVFVFKGANSKPATVTMRERKRGEPMNMAEGREITEARTQPKAADPEIVRFVETLVKASGMTPTLQRWYDQRGVTGWYTEVVWGEKEEPMVQFRPGSRPRDPRVPVNVYRLKGKIVVEIGSSPYPKEMGAQKAGKEVAALFSTLEREYDRALGVWEKARHETSLTARFIAGVKKIAEEEGLNIDLFAESA